ncbi:MAG: phenylacetate--CoA ligase family protein [Candidatus Brocadiales bacterium]
MKTLRTIERPSENVIKKTQGELLKSTVTYAFETSTYYRRIFNDHGLLPSEVSLENLKRLPFTTKQDISRNNRSFFSVQEQDIAEIVSTTGTTGDPIFIALTSNDVKRLTYNEAENFGYIGVNKEDLFHIAVTCDNLFIAGIAYYRGLIKLGATVVRIGPQSIIRYLDIAKKLKPTGVVAVPSFMYHMVQRANENGFDIKKSGIEKIVLVGDSIRNADFSTNTLGSFIEDSFGTKCYSTYGITEGQVSFCECEYHHGLHSHPDLVLVEVVDDNGEPLEDGEIGELVITPLQLEGMPLIRYRTGDISFKISEPCPCGRDSLRIGPILGRKQHKLKVKGVTVYPKAIENVILKIKDVLNYQIEAYTDESHTDHIILRIGSHRNDNSFRASLIDILRAKVRVTPEIEIESPEEIEKRLFEGGSRKAIIFKDRRIKLHE